MLKVQTKTEALRKNESQKVQTMTERMHMCSCHQNQSGALFMTDKSVTSPRLKVNVHSR